MFTDMLGVIQHRVTLTNDTLIPCKPYPLKWTVCWRIAVVRHYVPYTSPIVKVKKKDGSNMVCVDFNKLNKITEVDTEPIKTAEDVFLRLNGKKYLSKIDLTTGYWQRHVAPRQRL